MQREVASILRLSNSQARDHAIQFGCDFQFVESEFSRAEPASRVEICQTSVNVKRKSAIETYRYILVVFTHSRV